MTRSSIALTAVLALAGVIAAACLAARGEADPDHDRVLRVLRAASSIGVHSVDPQRFDGFGYGRENQGSPLALSIAAIEEGDGVYGSIAVSSASDRDEVIDGVDDALSRSGPLALCYIPHHVLTATAAGETVHVHICFQCDYAVLLHGDTRAARYEPFHDRGALMGLLNRLLAAAAIPVAPPRTPPRALDDAAIGVALTAEQRAIIEGADDIELFSIDPTRRWMNLLRDQKEPLDHLLKLVRADGGSLGATTFTRTGARGDVARELLSSLRSDANMARCFDPRHLLVFSKGRGRVAAMVCFECSNLLVVGDRGPVGSLVAHDGGDDLKQRLNTLLHHRGIDVAP